MSSVPRTHQWSLSGICYKCGCALTEQVLAYYLYAGIFPLQDIFPCDTKEEAQALARTKTEAPPNIASSERKET